jgi:hypothetical protein
MCTIVHLLVQGATANVLLVCVMPHLLCHCQCIVVVSACCICPVLPVPGAEGCSSSNVVVEVVCMHACMLGGLRALHNLTRVGALPLCTLCRPY